MDHPASTIAHHNVATVATVEPTPQIAHSAAAVTELPYIPHLLCAVRIAPTTIIF